MKQFYKGKSLFKLSFLLVALFSVISVMNSCKNDDDEGFTDHIVKFEVEGTTGVVVKAIVTQVGTSHNTIFGTDAAPIALPWRSQEFFVNSSQSQINLDANAVLPNANSELKINLWVDGEIVKTSKAIGSGTKSVSIDYSFLQQ